MSASPFSLGAKVLVALTLGRCKAIAKAKARSAYRAGLVLDLAEQDMRRGRTARGRAGRVAAQLHGLLSRRQVQRILAALFSVSSSGAPNRGKERTHADP